MVDLQRPPWHRDAACRDDERWFVDPRVAGLERLRRVCRACPTAGECLRETLSLEPDVRRFGVLRCATAGPPAWRRVESLVAELRPVTPADWTSLASWVVDDDLDGVEVAPRPHRVAAVVVRRRRSGPDYVGAPFPRMRHYAAPVGTLTRSELVAARATA